MDQQLLEQTIQIKPSTMDTILPQLTSIVCEHYRGTQQKDMGQNQWRRAQNQQILDNCVKCLFYGLWNFDKMINQHYLSTNIAEMMSSMPEHVAFKFFRSMLEYLHTKYNLIDKHRINKFMQLIRYLLKKALEINQNKTDQILKQVIFQDLSLRSGIAYHIIDLYFQNIYLVKSNPEHTGKNSHKKTAHIQNKQFSFQDLKIFEHILQLNGVPQHVRLHVMEQVYEKYKSYLIELYAQEQAQIMEQKITQFVDYLMQLARHQQKQLHRKNIYTLIGFMKSDQLFFANYLQLKQQKARKQKQNKTKKISKHKKKIIKQTKTKRKQENKKNKKAKIISKRKFEMVASHLS